MGSVKTFEGVNFIDDRGQLNFFNSFAMKEVVRFYEIVPRSPEIIRAWQGHKREKKWFYCHQGSFVMQVVQIDAFDNPPTAIKPQKLLLSAASPMVLEVPGGHATGFKSQEPESRMIVFSNFTLNESKKDDFRFPLQTWNITW